MERITFEKVNDVAAAVGCVVLGAINLGAGLSMELILAARGQAFQFLESPAGAVAGSFPEVGATAMIGGGIFAVAAGFAYASRRHRVASN